VASKCNSLRRRGGAAASPRTSNIKLGPVAATYVSQKSCPKTCPFYNNGCYAEYGPMYWAVTSKVNASAGDDTTTQLAKDEAALIDELPADVPLRLHVVGDCSTKTAAAIVSAAADRYEERGAAAGNEASVWTYTHAWKKVPRKEWKQVSVLASCENADQVKEATEAGYATAVVVPEFKQNSAYEADGIKLIPCPQQTGKCASCLDCKLCTRDATLRNRGLTIAFIPHGPGTKKVRKSLDVI